MRVKRGGRLPQREGLPFMATRVGRGRAGTVSMEREVGARVDSLDSPRGAVKAPQRQRETGIAAAGGPPCSVSGRQLTARKDRRNQGK